MVKFRTSKKSKTQRFPRLKRIITKRLILLTTLSKRRKKIRKIGRSSLTYLPRKRLVGLTPRKKKRFKKDWFRKQQKATLKERLYRSKYKFIKSLKLRSTNLRLNSSSFYRISKKNSELNLNWINNWKNLHNQYQTVIVYRLVKRFFLLHGLYLNYFFFHLSHNETKVFGTNLGIYRPYKTLKLVTSYKKEFRRKKRLYNLALFILDNNLSKTVSLKFCNTYLPKKFLIHIAPKVFRRYKHERFFWESFQLVYAIFRGYASSNILGGLIYTHIRRNPKRLVFVAYMKRLLDWYFSNLETVDIEGVRLEVKGRFNAKSRTKKHIISCGRVRIHEKSSHVDYCRLDAFTKFGCLGIKVWVCPFFKNTKKYVFNTTQNKTKQSSKRKNSIL